MPKRTSYLAWVLCLLSIVAATTQTIIWLQAQESAPAPFDLVEAFGWGWAVPIVFSVTAVVIITRQPGNRVGWMLMLPALVTAVSSDNFLAEPRTELTPALWLLLWLSIWSWIPIIFSILLLPLHFPTGRPPAPKWRWINWLAVVMWIVFMLIAAFAEEIGPINEEWTLPNPIGIIPQDFGGPFLFAWPAGLLTITTGSVASLIVRYRRAGLVEKEQIKWLLYAAALFAIVYTIFILSNTGTDTESSFLSNLLFVASILTFPIAITIAILRYRLFDIDIIIRKTAVYGVLTALLALVYFGSVILLQTVFGSVVGEQSTLILVVSTLLIAALFSPLRRWLQGIIDRRFYRRKYDTQQVLDQFAQTARDETDLDNLTDELLTVLQETLQPQSVHLWTAPPRIEPTQPE